MKRPPYLAVGLLSAAALSYEILLTRLFAIIQWHHFAYMMISVAMLGYGAAGSLTAVLRERLLARHETVFAGGAAAFGVSAVACFLAAQALAFNPLEALWGGGQFARLGLIYLCLLVPFFCAAMALCVAFSRHGGVAPRLYAADIGGAGAGAAGVILLLFLLPPMRALAVIGALGMGAAAAILWREKNRAALVLAGAGLALAMLPAALLPLVPSEYKELSQALRIGGARVEAEESSPLGLLTVVSSPAAPFRYAPGMSLSVAGEPPPQLGVFTDAGGFTAITRFDGDLAPLAYLDGLTSALPYHLLKQPRVLVLGAGGGQDVLQALHHRAATVDAVELDGHLAALVEQRFGDFSGRPYSRPGVTLHLAEARGFAAATSQRFDLIQLSLVDAFASSAAGLTALAESYLYTGEAYAAYLARLEPGGLLAVTRWISLPPRDLPRLAATAIAALERQGVREPGKRLALIRSWRTGTLLVKNGDFTTEESQRIRAFCRERSFDIDWLPGLHPEEGERFNLLDRPYFRDAMEALLGPQRQAFLDDYKYRIEPVSDDRPYFFQFFKWGSLPEFFALRASGGMPLMEWGYPVLVATLAQATLLGALLILLPLGLARLPHAGRGRTAAYFAALGLAFMFVEIAFIQKLMLFLSHPLYAVAVALAGFLLFAGLGIRLAARAVSEERTARRALLAVAGLALLYLLLLPALTPLLLRLPDAARIAAALLLIAPLAVAMGMPFPLGLRRLSQSAPAMLPWAWGVNACVSVVAAVLATLLATHWGFNTVVLAAAGVYLSAVAVFPRS